MRTTRGIHGIVLLALAALILLADFGTSTLQASGWLPRRILLGPDMEIRRSGNVTLIVHADTDSPTADFKLIDVRTGTTPTTKFWVDEDGDVDAVGTIDANAYSVNGTSVITSGRVVQNLTSLTVDNINLNANAIAATDNGGLTLFDNAGNGITVADGGSVTVSGDLTVSGASTNFQNAIKAVDGSGSGVDADLLDNISSASFLRSDTNDTFTGGTLTLTNNADAPMLYLTRSDGGYQGISIDMDDDASNNEYAFKIRSNDGGTWTDADTNFIVKANETVTSVGIGTATPGYELDVVGEIRASSEIISTTANSFRAISGNYGLILRNDGTNTYFLFTASGDQYGTWNALRPLYMNDSTGNVTVGNGALSVIHGGNVGIGSASPTQKLDVVGTVEMNGLTINGSALTATPTEINQALDGISANVTDTALNTLTGGGNADSLHGHVSASSGTDIDVWYETDFTNGSDLEHHGTEAANGSIQLQDTASYTVQSSTSYDLNIGAGSYRQVSSVNVDDELGGAQKISAVRFYRYVEDEDIHVEIWNGNTAQIGTDSTTDSYTGNGYRTVTFATPVDVDAYTTVNIRVYNDGAAVQSVLGNASSEPYCYVTRPDALTGYCYVIPDQPPSELFDSWYLANRGITTDGQTATVDLINGSKGNLVTSMGADLDISGQGAANIGFKINLTRASSASNPTVDFLSRSFIATLEATGAPPADGTTSFISPSELFLSTYCYDTGTSYSTEATYSGAGEVKFVSMEYRYYYPSTRSYVPCPIRLIIDGDTDNPVDIAYSSYNPVGQYDEISSVDQTTGATTYDNSYSYYLIPCNIRFNKSLEIQTKRGSTYSNASYVGWSKDQ